MASCVFCRILAGELPSARVFEDESTVAFMDAGQVNPGHVLVVLKAHRETLTELSEEEAAALFRSAWRVARAVESVHAPAGLTLLQANRPAGWQTVPHVHLHVLPRAEDDGVGLQWPAKHPPLETLRSLAEPLRAALGG